jgi:general secretion pathway protein D
MRYELMPSYRDLRRRAALPVILTLALVLPSCESPHPISPDAIKSADTPTEIAPSSGLTRTNGRIAASPSGSGPAPVISHGESGAGAGHKVAAGGTGAEAGDEGVTLNYVDTDVREIVRQVLGDILKVNYVIDSGFQGQATIQTSKPLRREELLPTLQTLLSQNGGSLTYQNGLFRIGPADDASVVPPVVDGQTTGMGSQVVSLRFASAKQLVAVLQPYVGDGAKILADPSRNVVVVSGSQSARTSVVDLIRVFDTDYLAGQSYALFPVKSGDPTKIATSLQKALQADGENALAGSLSVIPVEQANAVMVVARSSAYLDRAAHLIAQIDRMSDDGGRNLHVYYLKNVQAQDLQPVLQRAVNPPSGGSTGETAPGSVAPTSEAAQVSSAASSSSPSPSTSGLPSPTGMSGTSGLGGSDQNAITGGSSATGSATGTNSPPPPPTPDVGQEPAGAQANGPQIVADTKSNTLIIVSTEAEYAKIEAAIRRLDVMPMQVLIDVTVAEVTLNDNLTYGTQFFLQHQGTSAILSNAQSATPTAVDTTGATTNSALFNGMLAPNFPGFAIARTMGNAQFAIEALKAITNVKIVSSPKLLVLDRQQARLEVGDLVPIISQTAQSVITADAPAVNSVEYQQTGVILTVTPRVNSGGLVTMDIDQSVSQVVATTSSSINSPTFQQRKVTSKVAVQDGDTISLAGLIQDTKTEGNSGIPILNEIPVIGDLFTTKSKIVGRTELLVLLTPRVVYDQHGAKALTEDLRNKFPLTSAAASGQH